MNQIYIRKAPNNEAALKNFLNMGKLNSNGLLNVFQQPSKVKAANADSQQIKVLKSEVQRAVISGYPLKNQTKESDQLVAVKQIATIQLQDQSTIINQSVARPFNRVVQQPIPIPISAPKKPMGIQIQSVFSLQGLGNMNNLTLPSKGTPHN